MSISALPPLCAMAWPLKPLEVPESAFMHAGSPPSSTSTQEAVGRLSLPRGTRVCVQGNARTAPRLIGLEAVVKRANGLGGWHWLSVVSTGEEVKLQRNALQVLELGPEESQESSDEEEPAVRAPALAMPELLERPRIRRRPRSLSPVPDIFKPAAPRPAGSPSASGRSGLSSRGVFAPVNSFPEAVDLFKLETASLRRYRRVHHLNEVDASASHADLASAVTCHFRSQEVVDEAGMLLAFCAALRRRSSTGGC
ncbi:MAG: hypothetical protein J3K34DRAFT_255062 [Monoraphidium minutum]|nr:MAG: hypothetical protein J3K34DRAFT_255062 [Monoraphidium minutum]